MVFCLAVNKFILPFDKDLLKNYYESIFQNWGTQGVKNLLFNGGPSLSQSKLERTSQGERLYCEDLLSQKSEHLRYRKATRQVLACPGRGTRQESGLKERLWPEALFKA